jgi:hypothetical protein
LRRQVEALLQTEDRIVMNEPPDPEVSVFAAAWELPADRRGAYLKLIGNLTPLAAGSLTLHLLHLIITREVHRLAPGPGEALRCKSAIL